MRRFPRLSIIIAGSVLSGICGAGIFEVLAENRSNEAPTYAGPAPQNSDLAPGPLFPHRSSPKTSGAFPKRSLEQTIAQCVQDDMEALGAPGASATVRLDGTEIFSRGFGFKRDGSPQPVDSNTRFRIGSITKLLTATAVMQQVEAGLVNLDAPVTEYIPELSLSGQWPAESITVRHLLTHSAALPDYYEDPLSLIGDDALGAWAGTLGNVRLHAPPGTFWNYSNPGFALAGLVAERASGIPYRDLVETRIFDAAGMNASTFDPAEVVASGNFAYGHHPESDGEITVYSPDAYDSWVASPSGLAFSTAPDMARWGQLLVDGGGAVISDRSISSMQDRQIYLDYIPGYHYGFGVFAESYNGLEVRHHGGNLTGWGAFLLWVPEERLVVAILGNTLIHLTDAAFCIVDAVLEPEPSPPVDYSTDPATWNRYEGHYEFMDNRGRAFDVDVTKTHDRFYITIHDPDVPGSYETDLVQLYLDTFEIDIDGDQILDPLFDMTFIRRTDPQSTTMWLRNRSLVGGRVLGPRRPGRRMAPQ